MRNVAEMVASSADSVSIRPAPPVAPQTHDKLDLIKGIGKVYAARLNEAGIYSFAALAEMTPERLAEIVQLREWQAGAPVEWIEQAKQLM